jgi:chromosome segregation ATPase
MKTAKVQYRDYVPYGYIAIEFCDVEFYGDDSNKLKEGWEKIKKDRYHKYDTAVNRLQYRLDSLTATRKDLEKIKNAKPWFRFWYNKEEKEAIAKIEDIFNDIVKIEEQIEEYENLRHMTAQETKRVLEEFLKDNGFVLTNTDSSGIECVTHTDIWVGGNK